MASKPSLGKCFAACVFFVVCFTEIDTPFSLVYS